MPDISRAILLPPPSSQRSAQGTDPAGQDLPVQPGARRNANAGSNTGGGFLTLIESRREDSIEFTADSRGAKQFRFRPYANRGGTAERETNSNAIERPDAGDLAPGDAASEDGAAPAARAVLDGFASGDGSRNSSAFLASFIAQEQLTEGLYNPPYGGASNAYRRAGGSPPVIDDRPRVVSFAA